MNTTQMNVTTLTINRDQIDYLKLSPFKLVKYKIPDIYWNDKFLNFGRVHNAYKNVLEYPYYFFTGDRKKVGLYVLYRKDDKVEDLTFDFLQNDKLISSPIQFQDVPLHLLLKILAANYFVTRKETVSHNKFYIQAKSGKGKTIICVEIEIKGAMKNVDGDGNELCIQQFKILNHATHFSPRVPWGKKATTAAKFRKIVRSGRVFFRQLKPKEAVNFEGDTYYIDRDRERRAVLDFHSASEPESTRGNILHQFIKKFIPYLEEYGITATQNVRNFIEHAPQIKSDILQVSDLETVHLFDNRLNKKDVAIQDYALLLNEKYREDLGLTFEVIEEELFDPAKPLLILQDCNKKDFDDDGPLPRAEGWNDPKTRIYKAYPHIPKQSINVNVNNPNQFNSEASEEYLKYDLVDVKPKSTFNQRFQVCFNELYLKDLILNRKSVCRLPGLHSGSSLHDYTFIRRKTKKMTTALCIKNDKFELIDLRVSKNKQRFQDDTLAKYNLDWIDDIIDPYRSKHKQHNKKESELSRFDFIVGPNQVIEIENIEERVLYDYDAILERKRDLDKPYPIEELKLARHYHKIKPKKITEKSVTLEQCQAYDAFLDDLARGGVSRISFNELTQQEEYWQTIIEALEIKPRKNGKYTKTRLKTYCYNKIGMFLSSKAKDVTEGYSGIWYDAEGCFMIGSSENFKFTQPRAHLIRRFNVYKGEELFDIKIFLDTTAVKFVRFNQFTVYPYFFHMIDMYV